MSWTKTTYFCVGTTARGGACWTRRPYPDMYCWHHRDQRPTATKRKT